MLNSAEEERERISLADVCDRARMSRRQREVVELMAEGLDAGGVAERLGIAVGTVHVHAGKAREKLRRAQQRHEAREFYGFLLDEAMRGPVPCNPPAGNFRVTGPGTAERVCVNVRRLVTVEDLMRVQGNTVSGE